MAVVPKSSVPILATVAVPPGGTKAAPNAAGIGQWINVGNVNGGVLGGRIRNLGGTVTGQATLLWQWSPDPTATTPKIYDLWQFGGGYSNGDDYSASVRLDKEINWVRSICFGNGTSPVTFESDLAASS